MVQESVCSRGVFPESGHDTADSLWRTYNSCRQHQPCTVNLYYLLRASTLQMKTGHVPGFGIRQKLNHEENGCQTGFPDNQRKVVSCNIHPGIVVGSFWELPFPVF